MAAVVGDIRIFRMETNERIVSIEFGSPATKSLTEVPDITRFTETSGEKLTQVIYLNARLMAVLSGEFAG